MITLAVPRGMRMPAISINTAAAAATLQTVETWSLIMSFQLPGTLPISRIGIAVSQSSGRREKNETSASSGHTSA